MKTLLSQWESKSRIWYSVEKQVFKSWRHKGVFALLGNWLLPRKPAAFRGYEIVVLCTLAEGQTMPSGRNSVKAQVGAPVSQGWLCVLALERSVAWDTIINKVSSLPNS